MVFNSGGGYWKCTDVEWNNVVNGERVAVGAIGIVTKMAVAEGVENVRS